MKKKTFKEEKDMEEMGMKRELTPEERIEQIDIKAIQDSGFSREEAMQIFTITMRGNMIPPLLRR